MMSKRSYRRTGRLGAAFACYAVLGLACGDDDKQEYGGANDAGVADASTREDAGDSESSRHDGGADAMTGLDGKRSGHLVVVTERESPETNLQYLHLLDDWPEDDELDYQSAVELGEFVNVYAMGDSVFVHQPDDATVRKLVIGANGSIEDEDRVSFLALGVAGYSGDMIYVSETRAYFLDEAAGQIVTWNPSTMEVVESNALDEGALRRDSLAAQISRGIALEGEGFVAASWRDWDTLAYHDAAAMGVFDATVDDPELQIVEDDRCASTVTTPFDGGDGFVYLVSDAALGFDALANPTPTEKSLCVLRMRPGAGEFDPDFFLDLEEVLESPGFYAVHPMRDGKLLVNLWAPDVELNSVADPEDSSWYWDYPPYFEYAVVDLSEGTSTPVPDLPRAAVQWSVTLRVDGETYVQTYREDTGSDLYRVDPDGSIARVLSNGAGVDVQYLGRVEH